MTCMQRKACIGMNVLIVQYYFGISVSHTYPFRIYISQSVTYFYLSGKRSMTVFHGVLDHQRFFHDERAETFNLLCILYLADEVTLQTYGSRNVFISGLIFFLNPEI